MKTDTIFYPHRGIDAGVPKHYRDEFFDSGCVIRVYLDEVAQSHPASLGLEVVQLVRV
jgi:hypothetical protein